MEGKRGMGIKKGGQSPPVSNCYVIINHDCNIPSCPFLLVILGEI